MSDSGSSGGFNLGNAYGAVIIDVSGVGSAMQQAQSMIADGVKGISGVIGGIGDTISRIGDQMSNLGSSLSFISVPLGIAGKKGLDAAADFDTLLKQIEVFGNVAPNQLDTVRQFALKMGADTKFSSADAAEALLNLLKAGQTLEQAMKTLPEVLSLAAAGGLDLAQASGIVSSSLAIFSLKAEDAGRVSDALARAANASQADVADLGQGLANVGPVAAQFGLSIEDTSAVLGVFANRGIAGAEAGTQLKSMLLHMSQPTDRVTGAFKMLGVSLYDSQGNARNFNTVIKELDAAMDKLPVEQQNILMQDLAGSYGIVGLNALRASGGIDGMLQSMSSAPSAAKVANEFMNTFKGKIESLTGSIETLMISAMTPFMNDALTPLVAKITDVANSITDWTQKNPELTKQIVKVLAVVAALGPGLLVAGKALSSVGAIIKMVGTAISLFTAGPLGLLIAAVGGLAYLFRDQIGGLITSFVESIQAGIDPIEAIGAAILDVFGSNSFTVGIANTLINIREGFDTLIGVIGNLPNIIANQGIGEAVAALINPIWQALGLVGNDDMAQGAENVAKSIVGAFQAAGQVVQTSVIPLFQSFINLLSTIWSIVGPPLQQLVSWLVQQAFPSIVNFISVSVIPIISQFIDTLTGIVDGIGGFVRANPEFIIALGLIAGAVGIVTVVLGGLALVTGLVSGAVGLLTAAIGILLSPIVLLIAAIAGIVYVASQLYPGGLSKLFNDASTAAKELAFLGMYVLASAASWAQQKVQELMDTIMRAPKALSDLAGIFNLVTSGQVNLGDVGKAVGNEIGANAGNKSKYADVAAKYWGSGSVAPIPPVGGGSAAPPKRDGGGAGLAMQPYMIGNGQLKNEVYIPGADGQFVSGFVDLMKSVAAGVSGGSQGGDTINVMMPAAALASPAAAQANGEIFGRAVAEEMRARGIKSIK